jgi:hypothetical protein
MRDGHWPSREQMPNPHAAILNDAVYPTISGKCLRCQGGLANQFPPVLAPGENQGLINAVNTLIGSLERRLEMNLR